MRFLVSVGVTLAAATMLFAVGWASGAAREKAAHKAAQELIREAADAVDSRVAERISAIRVVNQTVSGRVREVVRENTVYRDCVVDPALQRVLEAAREGRAEPAPAGGGLPPSGEGAAP